MKKFVFKITAANGIHARPAFQIAEIAKAKKATAYLKKEGKHVNVEHVFEMVNMKVCCGDKIEVYIDGADERKLCEELYAYFTRNL